MSRATTIEDVNLSNNPYFNPQGVLSEAETQIIGHSLQEQLVQRIVTLYRLERDMRRDKTGTEDQINQFVDRSWREIELHYKTMCRFVFSPMPLSTFKNGAQSLA